MKFIVDAQLPKRLSRFIEESGYDCLHTQELPKGNATSDAEINELSLREQRIVITKDADFVQSFLLQNKPYKLLLISTGNIRNQELEKLLRQNLQQLSTLFETHHYVELGRDAIVVHQ